LLRLDPDMRDYLRLEAKQGGIPLSGLIRAILEGYLRKKTGCNTPYFSPGDKALERVAHVRFLQAIGRFKFLVAGHGLDVPALREKRLLEVCDIIDQLNALAAKTRGTKNRLYIHDRIARFYRIFDMMAKNAEYDEIKRMLDEMEADETARVGGPQETSDNPQTNQG